MINDNGDNGDNNGIINDYDQKEIDETKDAWRERMIKQYHSYKYPQLRMNVVDYYDNQSRRLAFENRVRIYTEIGLVGEKNKAANDEYVKNSNTLERHYNKIIEEEISKIPIYSEYLAGIRGIGPVTAGCLISYIDGMDEQGRQTIARFDTISALHRYAGLSAIDGKAQKRTLGRHIDYNPKLKTLMFKIGSSFIKAKNQKYRAVYDEAHEQYDKRGKWSKDNPTGNKNKLHTMFRSMKKMERVFLANVWVKWRELEGLPVSDPYVFAVAGHDRGHMVKA